MLAIVAYFYALPKFWSVLNVFDVFVDELLSIDKLFSNTPIESIQIFSPFHKEINNAFLNHINNETSRIYNGSVTKVGEKFNNS